MAETRPRPKPERLWGLAPAVLLINLGVLGLILVYSALNLRPFIRSHDPSHLQSLRGLGFLLSFLAPTAAALFYLRPVHAWLRERPWRAGGAAPPAPEAVITRAANAPLVLAGFSLLSWIMMTAILFARIALIFEHLTPGDWAHFIVRPLLGGLIAAAGVFFAGEYLCRTHAWPVLFTHTAVEGNPRLWKIRLSHRIFLLWMAIGFLPLGAVALTAFIRLDTAADPLLVRVMAVIIFIGASAALGGAWLAWLLARSMGRQLRALERAMARLRGGDFGARERVSSTDEIGSLTEGFNLMAGRLEESYRSLEARNRELAEALDRVAFLESVKRGLDRFVPDTVRRLIEENPDAPALHKAPRDVTVMFLDIEGYSRLSERLPREALTALVERYFSLYLSDIRAGGGDINETAGDGLMILFQEGTPEAHAASAIRAALAIREKTERANAAAGGETPAIAVNIGVSSGECDVGSTRIASAAGDRWTFTATGPVTNLAARLGDRATSGQILISSETARRAGGRFRLNGLGRVALKNLAEPVEVWEVSGPAAGAPA